MFSFHEQVIILGSSVDLQDSIVWTSLNMLTKPKSAPRYLKKKKWQWFKLSFLAFTNALSHLHQKLFSPEGFL